MSIYTYIEVLDENDQVIHRVDVTGKSERSIDRVERGMLINLKPEYTIEVTAYNEPQPLNP